MTDTDKPQRKHPRLKEYDYSSNGLYFVTVCTAEHKEILSRIRVGRGLAPAEVELTKFGKIAEVQLRALADRYPCVEIEKYIVMPNHLHLLVFIDGFAAGASPRPTLSDIICSFKSLTVRECRKLGFTGSFWQASFYDHIIRNQQDYAEHYRYIEDNPTMWVESIHTI